MYADPQTITIDGVATPMPRQGSDRPAVLGTFSSQDGKYTFDIRQNRTANRFRRELRLTEKKVAADPLTATNREVSSSVMVVVDEPRSGFSDEELLNNLSGLMAWISDAHALKLLGGEN